MLPARGTLAPLDTPRAREPVPPGKEAVSLLPQPPWNLPHLLYSFFFFVFFYSFSFRKTSRSIQVMRTCERPRSLLTTPLLWLTDDRTLSLPRSRTRRNVEEIHKKIWQILFHSFINFYKNNEIETEHGDGSQLSAPRMHSVLIWRARSEVCAAWDSLW